VADDAPSFSPDQREHYEKMFAAMAEAAEHCGWLISDEMKDQFPEYQERESAAAAWVAELWEILQEPEAELSGIPEVLLVTRRQPRAGPGRGGIKHLAG
jgi:hypothetical protein